jgi:hypothetical protein
VRRPHLGQLVLAEAHRAREQHLLDSPLVAELDQLAHDRVEHRDSGQGGRCRAICGMLVRLRRNADQALVFRELVGHRPFKVVGL